ncbi:MAG: TraB/GumN family protein [Novosphingobium sp.]|jgi:uncharacterized protein YbaP (TraB family)|nr:TraB/GumN family protein [Novosphingobium sp.]
MKLLFRRIACLLLALFFHLPFAASAQPFAPAGQASPALWKVSDQDTTIYIFGTIHVLPPEIDWFRGTVQRAFDGSQELVTEITGTDPAAMQRLVLSHAMLPPGQSLRGMLTPELKTSYEKELVGFGLPAQAFDGYEPWYAAVALSTLPLIRSGYAGENGVEQVLDQRAKALGHPHSALETAEYQIGLFDSLPAEAQKRYFAEVVGKLPTVAGQFDRIIDAWRKGDAESLASLMNDDEDDPELIGVLLINRNRAWAEWVRQRLAKPGTVFVAVGAGHLAGPGSLQEQLAAQGIAAERVQ